MNVEYERGNDSEWKAPETRSLYRERPSLESSLDSYIQFVKKLEAGSIPEPELSSEELEVIAQSERQFGEQLKIIQSIDVKSSTLYPEYFLSEDGAKQFEALFGVAPQSLEHATNTILQAGAMLRVMDAKKREVLEAVSSEFARDQFLALYGATESSDQMKDPVKIALVLDPENLQKKNELLRGFHEQLRQTRRRVVAESGKDPADFDRARLALLNLYQRKTNEMSAGLFREVAMVAAKRDRLGEEVLSESEKKVLSSTGVVSTKNWDRSLDRYDKFLHGASSNYRAYEGVDGETLRERVQIPDEIVREAQRILDETKVDIVRMSMANPLRERGIDPAKIASEQVGAEKMAGWFRSLLQKHGLESGELFDPRQPTKNPDDKKWRVYISPGKKVLQVKKLGRVIFVPEKRTRDITEALPVAGHEFTHVLQAENMQRASERNIFLLEELSPDRNDILNEGGGLEVEGELKHELFGLERLPKPALILGMAKRLEGASFKEVFQVMDQTTREILDAERAAGIIPNDEAYTARLAERRKEIYSGALRYFAGPVPMDSREHYLFSSRASVYTEQVVYMKKLHDAGLGKLRSLGVNPEAIRDLFYTGLFKPRWDEIRELDPKDIQEIWEQEKGAYTI